jgi:hypothetical protein
MLPPKMSFRKAVPQNLRVNNADIANDINPINHTLDRGDLLATLG